MAKVSQLIQNESSQVLVFGEPLSGKTTLVGELLDHGFHLWYFSLDNKYKVLFKGRSLELLEKNLDVFVLPDTRDFPVAVGTIRAVLQGKETLICDAHGQAGCSTCRAAKASFSTIDLSKFGPKDIMVIDHAGQLSDSIMAFIDKKNNDPDGFKAGYDEYRSQGNILADIFTRIQQAKANIIVITHTIESEQEDGKKKLFPHIGTGNYSRNSSKYFTHIAYLNVANGKHSAGSSTTFLSNVVAGSRTDIAIEKLEKVTLKPFFDGTIPGIKRPEQAEKAAAKVFEVTPAKLAAVSEELVSSVKMPEKGAYLPPILPAAKVESIRPAPEPEKPTVSQQQVTKAAAPPGASQLSLAEKLAALKGGK